MKPLITLLLSATIMTNLTTGMTNLTAGESQAPEALISIQSKHSVADTANRFAQLVEDKGLTLFSRISHSDNASKVDLELAPTEVILFGNPLVGTKLMQCAPTMAIDLPQKALIWQDKAGDTHIAYNNPDYLKLQHNIEGCDEILQKVSGLLAGLSKAAAE